MTEVWQLTRAEFVGSFKVDDDDLKDLDRTFQYEIEEYGAAWLPKTMRPVPSAEGFFFADVRDRPGDVVLLQEDPVDGSFDVVGGYVEEFLWLDGGPSGKGGVRGRGLSAELVLAKMEKVGAPFDVVSYTSAGKAAHESAHRLAVQRALRAGYRVPERVLADYPEFRESAPAPASAAGRRVMSADEVKARLLPRRKTAEVEPVDELTLGPALR